VTRMPAPRPGPGGGRSALGRFNVGALVWFCALACALGWVWVIPWAAAGRTVCQGSGWPAHLPGLPGSLLAAFAVAAWAGGAAAIGDLVSRMGRWQIGWRWWLAVFCLRPGLRRRRGGLAVQPQRRHHPGGRDRAWPLRRRGQSGGLRPRRRCPVIWAFVVASAIALVIQDLQGAPARRAR
jgi:hypothetical protein